VVHVVVIVLRQQIRGVDLGVVRRVVAVIIDHDGALGRADHPVAEGLQEQLRLQHPLGWAVATTHPASSSTRSVRRASPRWWVESTTVVPAAANAWATSTRWRCEALAHGVLPGPDDASIGILFVGFLSLAVVIMSTQRASYAGDLNRFLFGSITGVTSADVNRQLVARRSPSQPSSCSTAPSSSARSTNARRPSSACTRASPMSGCSCCSRWRSCRRSPPSVKRARAEGSASDETQAARGGSAGTTSPPETRIRDHYPARHG
jgi:ABC 3 transport family